MSFRRTLALSLLVGGGILAPAPARADGLFIPFIGVNFAGNSGNELSNAIDAERLDWGASLGYMGGGFLGIEADIGYSPDFYGRSDIGGSSVLTAMGNLLIGIPFGGQTGVGIRPYVLAGLGVVRSKIDAFDDVLSVENSKAGWDFGGGAMFFFGTHVGLRADVRYFRTFSTIDLIDRRERLDFGRASTGLILRF
jgi:opacity protein-like surface antigen